MELPETPASTAVYHGELQEAIVLPPQEQMRTKKLNVVGGGLHCQPKRLF